MARKKKAPEGGGGAGWLVTYGDLMTLLLCFFVLLYGMSSVDEGKYQQLAQSLKEALMGNSGKTIFDQIATPEEELTGDPVEQDPAIEGEMNEDEEPTQDLWAAEMAEGTLEALDQYFKEEGLDSEINVELVEEGLLLDIKETVLFDMGEASIKSESLQTLNKLGKFFKKVDNDIRVVGHTDNVPIKTEKYPSNWELAAARSCAIVRYYTSQSFDSKQFMCLSQGESAPIASNQTEAGRAQNRRVNFLIVGTPSEIMELVTTLKEDE